MKLNSYMLFLFFYITTTKFYLNYFYMFFPLPSLSQENNLLVIVRDHIRGLHCDHSIN